MPTGHRKYRPSGRAAGLAASFALSFVVVSGSHAQEAWKPTFEFDALAASVPVESSDAKLGFNPAMAIATFKPAEWAVLDAPARVRGGVSSYTVAAGEALAGFQSADGRLAFCHLPMVSVTLVADGKATQHFDPTSSRATIGCFLDSNGDGSFDEWFTSYRTPPMPPAWRIKSGRTGKEDTPIPYRRAVEGKQPMGQMALTLDQFRGDPDVSLFAYEVTARGQMMRNSMLIGPKAERLPSGGESRITLGGLSVLAQPGSKNSVRYRLEGDLKGAHFPEGWLTGR
jgi:hypothetical protein